MLQENGFGTPQVRSIKHLPVQLRNTHAGRKRLDHLFGPGDIFVAENKRAIDDLKLRGMDRRLGGKTITKGRNAFVSQGGLIMQIR